MAFAQFLSHTEAQATFLIGATQESLFQGLGRGGEVVQAISIKGANAESRHKSPDLTDAASSL
jgi:hypothetical protein